MRIKNYLLKPTTIQSGDSSRFVRKPSAYVWGFTVGNLGQYNIIRSHTCVLLNLNFMNQNKQMLYLNIFIYAGIIIRDPQIVQAAAEASSR